MQQMSRETPAATATPSPGSSTGPGAEPSTQGVIPAETLNLPSPPCVAEVLVKVDHDRVTLVGTLTMGGQPITSLQQWERRRNSPRGWVRVAGPDEFVDHEDRIGVELAEYLDGLDFPFALANMLPRPASPAAAALVAEAAKAAAGA